MGGDRLGIGGLGFLTFIYFYYYDLGLYIGYYIIGMPSEPPRSIIIFLSSLVGKSPLSQPHTW